MKKIIPFIFLYFAFLLTNAQYVETYPNNNRFYYTTFSGMEQDAILWLTDDVPNSYTFLTNTFETTSATIYGVAIPIATQIEHLIFNHFGYNHFPSSWKIFMDSILGDELKVFVGQQINNSDSLSVLAIDTVLGYKNTIESNYFKIPDSILLYSIFDTNPILPVIEVYFETPVTVRGEYYIGCNLISDDVLIPIAPGVSTTLIGYGGVAGLYVNHLDGNPMKYYEYSNSSSNTLTESVHPHGVPLFFLNDKPMWGGPFAIIAPPPCSIPMYLEANNVGKRKARLQWNAQYANTHFQLEYGPQDFTPGTGTTIAPIYPNQNGLCSLTVDSLDMSTDYTFRVRAWCDQATDYSQWVETNLTTEQWYTIFADVNNDDWGRITGNGDYRAGSQVTLTAWPKGSHFRFQIWSDGVTANPRNFTANSDLNLTAVFSCDTCNEDITLPDAQGISIYPNPSDGKITLLANTAIMHVDILDIQGRILLSLDSNSLTIPLDLSFLNKGIYIVSAQTHKGSFHKKIILK